MSTALVSIGMPTYNRPEVLKRALNCLLSQTYSNIEIILSNNCSTDPKVEEVISEYLSDQRIKYFKQQENIGAVRNQKFVLGQATGDYYMNLSDDDTVDVDYIEKCVSFLSSNPGYATAYGFNTVYKQNGEVDNYDVNMSFEEEDPRERVKSYLQNVTYNGPYYGLVKKDLLKYAGSKVALAHDWFIVSRILYSGKGKMIRDTNISISTGGISQSIDNIVVSFGLSPFTQRFPYYDIAFNMFRDILYRSSIYKNLNIVKRYFFAKDAYRVLRRRFHLDLKKFRREYRKWKFGKN